MPDLERLIERHLRDPIAVDYSRTKNRDFRRSFEAQPIAWDTRDLFQDGMP
jgi:hypothetical protein